MILFSDRRSVLLTFVSARLRHEEDRQTKTQWLEETLQDVWEQAKHNAQTGQKGRELPELDA